jgi:hypothetical protein
MGNEFDFEAYMDDLRARGLVKEYHVTVNVTNPMAFLAILPEESIEMIYQTNLETENYEFCQIIKEFRERKKSTCKSE